jgi:phosphoribosyl 1,2-cyclic phosphodiesterase
MRIKTFASGSTGNLHLVEISGKRILLECGVSIRKILEFLDFDLNIDACLLSHYHADHAKSAKHIIKAGIDLYCSVVTADNLNFQHEYIENLKIINYGNFSIDTLKCTALSTNHDVLGSYAFLISDNDNTVLFATDTGFFNYRIENLTHIIIECNYSEETITEKNKYVIERTRKTHMSLDDCIYFLKINNLSRVKEIHLIHLSEKNADKKLFKKKIQELTGKMVIVE